MSHIETTISHLFDQNTQAIGIRMDVGTGDAPLCGHMPARRHLLPHEVHLRPLEDH